MHFGNIVNIAITTLFLLISMILGVSFFWHAVKDIFLTLANVHVMKMKPVVMLVIFCRLVHQNNSNYQPLLIVLYMYLFHIWIDAITFFNSFGLLVSYDVLQQKLQDILKNNTNPNYIGLQKVKQLGLKAK